MNLESLLSDLNAKFGAVAQSVLQEIAINEAKREEQILKPIRDLFHKYGATVVKLKAQGWDK